MIPAPSVATIDSTGAGDAFNAGLATALGEGLDLNAAVRFANVAAALSTTRRETVHSYHRRTEVDEVLGRFGAAASSAGRV